MDFRNSIAKSIKPYVPGEQPQTPDWFKLNTNENPYEPAHLVLEELKIIANNSEGLRKYSHPYGEPLRSRIAQINHLKPENVLVTNGSDEALILICRTFLELEEKVATSEVSYSLYDTLVQSVGAKMVHVACLETTNSPFDVNLNALTKVKAKIIFLPNPNAQTGELFSQEDLKSLIKANPHKLWVIDEAYIDFCDDNQTTSMIEKVNELANIIVTRTFSKSYSLAGLRLGYAVANETLILAMSGLKDSYNIDYLATQLGYRALAAQDYYDECLMKIRSERKILARYLKDKNFFVIDSQANFILAKPKAGSAKSLYEFLKQHKILIRHFSNSKISDYVRITIGTNRQNKLLIEKINLWFKN